MNQRYFIYLAYNGKNYHGWQRQENGISVQEKLEHCLSLLLKQSIVITGAGRTDTGVHASFYVAHFDIDHDLNASLASLIIKLNSFLPQDIVIYDIREVKPETHARFDAISRTYEYHLSRIKNPFKKEFQYLLHRNISQELSLELINEACQKLFNYNDFTSFCKIGAQTKTNLCTFMQAICFEQDNEIIIKLEANRFLRNMVRAIVGSLIEVGTKKISISDFCQLIELKDRTKAGSSAPAHALFLVDIKYPHNIYV